MAALAMTPKLLGHISNEKYQEKHKWKIDDIALGPANELLISGHNLEISETFISMYKEYSGKYENFPEFNKNFYQTQPGKQLVLFLEGSSIIGWKVESTIRFINIEDMGVLKTLTWKQSPTCVCLYRGKLYAASSSSTIVSVFNLDSEDKSCITLSDMRSDCVLEFVVVMEKIYVCTKDAGRALVFSMTGSKKMEFKNAIQTDALARSICIHERTERVFISWSNFQIQLYSQKTSQCLYAFDMTEELHKILVTTEKILVTLSASKCIVSVYDVADSELENLQHEKKQLEKEKDSLQHQQQQLRNEIKEEKQIGEISKQALKRAETKLKKVEERNTKLEDEVTKLKERLLAKERTAKEVQTSSLKLNEKIKELEMMKTELESQQKKLKDSLEKVKEKVTRESKSRVKLIERIIELDWIRTDLESQQKKLKDNLEEEKEKVTREEISSFQLKEKIKELEDIKTELESQQKKLKDKLEEEKEKGTRESRSRVQAEYDRKRLEQTQASLEKEKEYLTKLLAAGERNETELKKSLAKVVSNSNEVEERNTKLVNEVTQLQERLLAEEKIVKEVQTSSSEVHARQKELEDKILKLQEENEFFIEILSTGKREAIPQGMLSRFLSDAEQRNVKLKRNPAINGMDELESVIAESVDTGICSSSSISTSHFENLRVANGDLKFRSNPAINDKDDLESVIAESVDTGIYSCSSTRTNHFENLRVANGEQLNPDLKVAVTLTVKGAHMHIPDTGVELNIPTGAVRRKRLIEMTIIPFDKQVAPIVNFSSNSSVVVELLPNKARFSLPVHLKLPHCLQLKKNYKEIKNPVKVFVSHHEAGPPVWKEDSSAKCALEEGHCVIRLKQFCWVKYEINDKIVVAKRLKVFTAGKSLHPNDSIAEIEVGYYIDLPGRAENMSAIRGMDFYQTKPFVFVKEGKVPLQLVLSKIVPKEWTYITPDENPKIISYKSIADDKDTSCPFVLEKSRSSERSPYCIFKIVQGIESVELSMRF